MAEDEKNNVWEDLAESMEGIGLKLKLHVEESLAEGAPEREALERAVGGLRDAVGQAFNPVRDAVQDPAIRDDVNRMADRLGSAVSDTFGVVRSKVRRGEKP